eukprot:358715-Chlamydomonas_euryale.AAC.5
MKGGTSGGILTDGRGVTGGARGGLDTRWRKRGRCKLDGKGHERAERSASATVASDATLHTGCLCGCNSAVARAQQDPKTPSIHTCTHVPPHMRPRTAAHSPIRRHTCTHAPPHTLSLSSLRWIFRTQ